MERLAHQTVHLVGLALVDDYEASVRLAPDAKSWLSAVLTATAGIHWFDMRSNHDAPLT